MEYWFPEHAVTINKVAFWAALGGFAFCALGAIGLILGNLKKAGLPFLLANVFVVDAIAGALI